MDHILVLTAAADHPLDDALLAALPGDITARLPEGMVQLGAPNRLDRDGLAAEIPVTAAAEDVAAIAAAARGLLLGRPIDANLVPRHGRRKALLVADMDATIVTGESLDELAAHAGLADQVVPITERAMRGELDFREALIARVRLLAGQDAALIDAVLAGLTMTPGAGTLVATMRAAGARCVLVSGGFDCFVGPVATRLGFDLARGNGLDIAGGRITGTVREPVLGREAKLETLQALSAEAGIAAEAVIAVGDGANDIPMLQAAGLGVAFRGKPAVKAAVPVAIDHADLAALLHLQGFPADEFRRQG